jgi:hypothetical protein
MSSQKRQGEELEGDITFIATPAAIPSKFATGEDCGVETTNVSTIEISVSRQLISIGYFLTEADDHCSSQQSIMPHSPPKALAMNPSPT